MPITTKPIALDGQFQAYSTLDDLPNQPKAETLLRVLSAIVEPLMLRSNIVIPLLEELALENTPLGNNELYGEKDKHGRYKSKAIGLRLRISNNPAVLLPLEECLATLLHELAHIWHRKHNQDFFKRWKRLMDEVECDLDRRLLIRRDSPRGRQDYTDLLKWEQWITPSKEEAAELGCIKPSRKSLDAAWYWEFERYRTLDTSTASIDLKICDYPGLD